MLLPHQLTDCTRARSRCTARLEAAECLNLHMVGWIRWAVDCQGASVLLASKVVSDKLSPMERLFWYLGAAPCNVRFVIII